MKRAAVEHRRQQALSLALAGHSYDDIARELGYANRSGVWKLVSGALRARLDESVAEYRATELARLDALQAAHWHAALGGDINAVNTCVRVILARVKLLGLDRPEAQGDRTPTVVLGPSSEEYVAGLKKLAAPPDCSY
jgi:hypothetical protein